jgi:hypothetical protein
MYCRKLSCKGTELRDSHGRGSGAKEWRSQEVEVSRRERGEEPRSGGAKEWRSQGVEELRNGGAKERAYEASSLLALLEMQQCK